MRPVGGGASIGAALLLWGLLTGCANAPALPAPPPAATPGGVPSQAVAVCERYTSASGTLQRVLAEMRSGPVLGPGVTFLLIVPRDIAATPGITDRELAEAMSELTAAIDDLGAQAEAKLPPGADPMRTPVPVDPTRAAAAATKADAVCAARG